MFHCFLVVMVQSNALWDTKKTTQNSSNQHIVLHCIAFVFALCQLIWHYAQSLHTQIMLQSVCHFILIIKCKCHFIRIRKNVNFKMQNALKTICQQFSFQCNSMNVQKIFFVCKFHTKLSE